MKLVFDGRTKAGKAAKERAARFTGLEEGDFGDSVVGQKRVSQMQSFLNSTLSAHLDDIARNKQVGGDQVNSPGHYTAGGIETIDFLRAKLTPEQLKGYYVGNLLKYISRAELKNGFEDYRKAQVYLSWLIELEGRAT